jgi:hypothetical protein
MAWKSTSLDNMSGINDDTTSTCYKDYTLFFFFPLLFSSLQFRYYFHIRTFFHSRTHYYSPCIYRYVVLQLFYSLVRFLSRSLSPSFPFHTVCARPFRRALNSARVYSRFAGQLKGELRLLYQHSATAAPCKRGSRPGQLMYAIAADSRAKHTANGKHATARLLLSLASLNASAGAYEHVVLPRLRYFVSRKEADRGACIQSLKQLRRWKQ